MLIDLTLDVTPGMIASARENEEKARSGHLGTHFDVMDREFPPEYARRPGIVFDVSGVEDRDIDLGDIDLNRVGPDMFVAFYTGFIGRVGYGNQTYFTNHPQLSNELIDALLDRGISIIGVDFAGVRRGREHTPKDQYCADRGVFIMENLCNLNAALERGGSFTAHIQPIGRTGMTGLPCRVTAEVEA